MTIADIFAALNTRLAALALTPAMAVAWPGVPFNPPAEGYLRVSLLPAIGSALSVGPGSNEARGVYQVDVLWPQDQGLAQPLARASQVQAWFKRGLVVAQSAGARLWVSAPPYTSPSLGDAPFTQVPVNVPWRATVPN